MDTNQSVSLYPTQETPLPPPPSAVAGAAEEEQQDEVFSSKSSLKSSSSVGGGAGGGDTDSSSSSLSSFQSEEAFMSGDDDFETASVVEENLELAGMVVEGPVVEDSVGEPFLGLSNFPPLVAKQEVSGGGNDVLDDGVVGEGSSGFGEIEGDGVVEEAKVGGLGSEEGEFGGKEGEGMGKEVLGEFGIIANDDNLVGNPENGVLASAGEGVRLEENPILESDLVEFGRDKVPGVTDRSVEALAEKKEDTLEGVNEVVDVAIAGQEEETSRLEVGDVEEKKSEIFEPCFVESGGNKVSGDIDGAVEALTVKAEDIVPEDSSSGEVVDTASGSHQEEAIALKDVAEEKKGENLNSGLIELVGDKVVDATDGSTKALVEKEDILPESLELSEIVDLPIGSQEEKMTELKEGAVEGEKNEIMGGVDTVTPSSTIGGELKVDIVQHTELHANGVSDIQQVELPVEKDAALTGDSQASSVINELIDSKLVETDNEVKLAKEGDSLVKIEQLVTSKVESNGVGEVEEKGTSGSETPALAVKISEDVGIVSDKAPIAAEEAKDPKLVEAFTGLINLEDRVSQTEGQLVEKVDELNNGGVVRSVSIDEDETPEPETEPETDLAAILTKPIVELADNGVELDEAQNAGACSKSQQLNIVQEDKPQVLIAESSDTNVASEGDGLEDVISSTSRTFDSPLEDSTFDSEVKEEAEDDVHTHSDYEEDEGSVSDEDNEGLIFDGSEAAKQIMKELMQGAGMNSHSAAQGSQADSQRIDGQIVEDTDEEVETDEEGDGKELFDSAALAALLKAATGGGSDGGTVTITSPDGSRLFSVERPAGLGSSVRPLRPAPRQNRPNIFSQSDLMVGGVPESTLSEEEKKKLEKIQQIRVKYLRLLHRLGHSPDDSIAAQVLYRLVLTAGRNTSEAFSLETAKKTAMQLESEGKDDLDFSLNILVLGKTGVGKSATINSIFGEEKTKIDAFQAATTTVKEIIGTVGGVKIRVIDTPGLRTSVMEQAFNKKILSSVKKCSKKCPPDILLYVDRLDTQTRDLNDLPLLRSITSTLGSSIWRSAVVTLTHGASAPPDGPSGNPLSYEVFVAQRSHVVQQSIGQAVGDLRMMNPSLMNPVTLVENHPSCRRNREGQRILPNGQSWRPQLLLLSYSLKILSEVNALAKPQDPFDHRKLFGFRVRSPPLPYLLSTLLQSRTHPKLPTDQGGENADSDIELEDLSDSDKEDEEDEYDQLPPFKPLRKAQIAKLSKEQRKAYFDEYEYRVNLLQKKQLKEELKRMREMKNGKNNVDYVGEDADPEGGAAPTVAVPLPDMVLPPSFDGDNPAYRYRFLEPTSQLLARPVLDTHGWDHDCGYDGVSLEENLAIAGRFPAGVAVQVTKDKKEFNIHVDSSVAAKHGENGSTLAGFDIQTIGKHLAYILRGETKFKKLKRNKMTGGLSITFLGESVATGLKFEDQISIGKRVTLVASTGTVRSQGDAAYGANLEARLKDKDYPLGQDQSTLGLSLMKWRGDLALGANLQTQFSVGRSSKMSVRVGLNNKLSGQIAVRTSSSEQLQLALVGILPIALSIYRAIWPETGANYSAY